jgi:RNA polymerase sigma-70 factor (ECF subfamily)
VVALNRAVAVGMAERLETGLALLDEIDARGGLAEYHLLPAAQADLLARLGRREEAAASMRDALLHAPNGAERRLLERRLAELTA